MQGHEVGQQFGRLHDCAGHHVALHAVHLIHHDHHRQAAGLEALGDEAIAPADLLGGIQQEQRGIGVGDRAVNGLLHAFGQAVGGALEPGQVEQHRLPALTARHGQHAAARGLRTVAHGGHVRARKGVGQRALTHVGAARQCDEARVQRRHVNPISGRAAV